MRKISFLFILLFFSLVPQVHADPSCEGRFVNPITDVCWRCIFPLSLGSVQVGKGDLPDTSNPGSPLQLCPAPPPLFVRPGLAIGYWEPMAMTDVSRSPGCMVNLGGFSINLGKTGMGTARKDDKQVNGAFYHVHWYKYPLTYWLNIITSAGCLEGYSLSVRDRPDLGGQQPHHHPESGSHPVCQPHRAGRLRSGCAGQCISYATRYFVLVCRLSGFDVPV